MPKIFRKDPPIELVVLFLRACGLKSIHDYSWFSKKHIHLKEFEEVLPELEPFYIPCKAAEYLYKVITVNRAITILRQVLRVYNIGLTSKEITRNSEKNVWYQIQPTLSPTFTSTTTDTISEILIDFA